MRLDFLVKLNYESIALILSVGIKYYVRELIYDDISATQNVCYGNAGCLATELKSTGCMTS